MNTQVTIFNNPQFGDIRTAGTPEAPLFCLADVCKALGLSAKGVNQRLTKDVISTYPLETPGGTQQALFVTEDGLYDVILDSRKPEAKAFRKWVTSEVLPAIRKHGAYMTDNIIERTLNDPDYLIMLANQLKDERNRRKELEEKAREDAPKVLFADAIVGSKSSCLVGELAKILTNNGIVIGQNRLFKWLREHHFLGTVGERYNIPNQEYIEQGLFELKKTVHDENGVMVSKVTTKVTGKGQQYFIHKFVNNYFTL
jgi:anti-repressor protein